MAINPWGGRGSGKSTIQQCFKEYTLAMSNTAFNHDILRFPSFCNSVVEVMRSEANTNNIVVAVHSTAGKEWVTSFTQATELAEQFNLITPELKLTCLKLPSSSRRRPLFHFGNQDMATQVLTLQMGKGIAMRHNKEWVAERMGIIHTTFTLMYGD